MGTDAHDHDGRHVGLDHGELSCHLVCCGSGDGDDHAITLHCGDEVSVQVDVHVG